MATCPFCGGFRDDTYECRCFSDWHDDCRAGRGPEGIIPGAFTYSVWRRIKALERDLQLHPETPNDEVQRRLQIIVDEANENRRIAEMHVQACELEKQKLANHPCPKLY